MDTLKNFNLIAISMDGMPSCCANCILFDDSGDYPTCYATRTSRGYNFNIYKKRMPNCPLKEYKIELNLKEGEYFPDENTIPDKCFYDLPPSTTIK